MRFTITVVIKDVELDDKKQADKVAEAYEVFAKTLSAQETIDLAALLNEKPGIVQKAKQYRHLF